LVPDYVFLAPRESAFFPSGPYRFLWTEYPYRASQLRWRTSPRCILKFRPLSAKFYSRGGVITEQKSKSRSAFFRLSIAFFSSPRKFIGNLSSCLVRFRSFLFFWSFFFPSKTLSTATHGRVIFLLFLLPCRLC